MREGSSGHYTGASMKRCPFTILVIFLFHSQLSASEMPDRERLERLGNGEILLLEARTDEAGGSARVQAIIHAPAKAAWDVIISCEQTFTFVQGLKKGEIIEDAGLFPRPRRTGASDPASRARPKSK